MKNRSVASVVVFSLITFGIYLIFWLRNNRREMVALGADIPTTWLMIVPIANIYYMWKWCGGVEKVTNGKQTQTIAFILLYVLNIIGVAIIQDSLNKAVPSQLPQARVA